MPPNSPQGLQNKSSRCGPRPPNAQLPHCAPTPACTRSVGPAGFWVPKCFVKGSCLTRPPSSVPRPLQNEGTKVQDAPRGKTSLGAHASLCSPAPPPLTRSQHPQSLLRATGSKNERSGKMRRGTPSPSSGFHAGRVGGRAPRPASGESQVEAGEHSVLRSLREGRAVALGGPLPGKRGAQAGNNWGSPRAPISAPKPEAMGPPGSAECRARGGLGRRGANPSIPGPHSRGEGSPKAPPSGRGRLRGV